MTMRAGIVLAAVDAVGVAGEREDAGQRRRARAARPSRNSALRPPRPLPRTVTVVSPPESSTAGGRQPAGRGARTERAMPAMTRPTSRASPSIASPRISGVDAGRARHGGRRFEARLRRGDDDGLARRRAADRRASASRPRAPRDGARDRRRRRRCRSGRGSPRASAKVVGSATVGPEAIDAGSSPGTSEMRSVTTRGRIGGGGEPAALDRREVLAHRVHLADVGAAGEQRAVDRLLVGEA